MSEIYEPAGFKFYDNNSKRWMLYVTEEGHWCRWICFRHPDGKWVSLREATLDDLHKLLAAVSEHPTGTHVVVEKSL